MRSNLEGPKNFEPLIKTLSRYLLYNLNYLIMASGDTQRAQINNFQPVYFQKDEAIVVFLTVGILSLLYLGVGILGTRNAYLFLIKQDRLKQALLTSFYVLSIFTCFMRVLSFLIMMVLFLVKSTFTVGLIFTSDLICSSTMLSVGIIQTLCCFHLGHAL